MAAIEAIEYFMKAEGLLQRFSSSLFKHSYFPSQAMANVVRFEKNVLLHRKVAYGDILYLPASASLF